MEETFPSPPRTSYFLMFCTYALNRGNGFPSPPGTSYFLMVKVSKTCFFSHLFPSPPGTSYFLIVKKRLYTKRQWRFRPLRGLLIF